MKDRVPKYPGRVYVTPENGGAPYYATIERADEPVEVGTPLNKANLLSDQTVEKYMFPESVNDPTVNDAFDVLAWASTFESKLTLITETITESSIFTVPSNIASKVNVLMFGGGGGGAGGPGSGGGGGGHMSQGSFDLSPLQTVNITIGAGGAGGASNENNGTAGGVTSFGSYLSANGGSGGTYHNELYTDRRAGIGGSGGTGGGGGMSVADASIRANGGDASYGGGGGGGSIYVNGNSAYGGHGGTGGTYGGGGAGGGGLVSDLSYAGHGGTGGIYGGKGGDGGIYNHYNPSTVQVATAGSSGTNTNNMDITFKGDGEGGAPGSTAMPDYNAAGGGGGGGYGGNGGNGGTVYSRTNTYSGGGGGGGYGGNGGNGGTVASSRSEDSSGGGGGGGYGGNGGNGGAWNNSSNYYATGGIGYGAGGAGANRGSGGGGGGYGKNAIAENADSTSKGGNGAPGIVIITYYTFNILPKI